MNNNDNTINNGANNGINEGPVLTPIESSPTVVEPPVLTPVNAGVVAETQPNTAPTVVEAPVLTPTMPGQVVVTPEPVKVENTNTGGNYLTPPPLPVPSENGHAVNFVITPVPVVPNVTVNTTPAPQPSATDNYKGPSKFKVIGMFLLFAILIGVVIFLPNITALIEKYRNGGDYETPEKITNGTLKCTASRSTSNLDLSFTIKSSFTNNELKDIEYVIITKGDASLDEKEISRLHSECLTLTSIGDKIEGVNIRCVAVSGQLTVTQNFDLSNLNSEKLDAAFYEAGGYSPEFDYNEDMDKVEKKMNSSGYSCERER